MRYTLLVLTPPDGGASARHALQFARAAHQQGHVLTCVFFFDAGVLTAAARAAAPADEADLRRGWREFAAEADLRLVACVASAERFGVVLDGAAGDAAFALAGLGDLAAALVDSDRLLTFRG